MVLAVLLDQARRDRAIGDQRHHQLGVAAFVMDAEGLRQPRPELFDEPAEDAVVLAAKEVPVVDLDEDRVAGVDRTADAFDYYGNVFLRSAALVASATARNAANTLLRVGGLAVASVSR